MNSRWEIAQQHLAADFGSCARAYARERLENEVQLRAIVGDAVESSSRRCVVKICVLNCTSVLAGRFWVPGRQLCFAASVLLLCVAVCCIGVPHLHAPDFLYAYLVPSCSSQYVAHLWHPEKDKRVPSKRVHVRGPGCW